VEGLDVALHLNCDSFFSVVSGLLSRIDSLPLGDSSCILEISDSSWLGF